MSEQEKKQQRIYYLLNAETKSKKFLYDNWKKMAAILSKFNVLRLSSHSVVYFLNWN